MKGHMDISNVYGNIPKIHFAIELIQAASSSAPRLTYSDNTICD